MLQLRGSAIRSMRACLPIEGGENVWAAEVNLDDSGPRIVYAGCRTGPRADIGVRRQICRRIRRCIKVSESRRALPARTCTGCFNDNKRGRPFGGTGQVGGNGRCARRPGNSKSTCDEGKRADRPSRNHKGRISRPGLYRHIYVAKAILMNRYIDRQRLISPTMRREPCVAWKRRRGPCDDHVHLPATAPGADKSVTPIQNRRVCAVSSKHPDRVGLDLVAARLAPHD